MEREKRVLEEVDKTLRVFDELPTLDANPFLFTRLQARLAAENIPEGLNWSSYPKLKPVGLVLIVILNIVTALHFFGGQGQDSSRERLVHSLSRDYESTQSDFLMGN